MPKAKSKNKLVSIVFSFRNEEDVLDELISRVETVFASEPEDVEMVFVNDDSTDASADILARHHQRNPNVKLLNMSRRFGVSECVVAGMEHASGDAVVYMDTDLQDPPEVIPDMLKEWREGAEMVYSVRLKREGERAFRMYMTKRAYEFISAISDVELPVNAGDFRLLDRKVVDKILSLPESNPYLRGLTQWIGFRQAKVEYVRAARGAGATHFPGTFSVGALKEFMKGITSFSFLPLLVFFIFGGGGLAIAAAGLILAVLAHVSGLFWSPWLYMGLFILALWGILMSALGVVGLYLGRIYADVRGRPRYIVKDSIGFDPAD